MNQTLRGLRDWYKRYRNANHRFQDAWFRHADQARKQQKIKVTWHTCPRCGMEVTVERGAHLKCACGAEGRRITEHIPGGYEFDPRIERDVFVSAQTIVRWEGAEPVFHSALKEFDYAAEKPIPPREMAALEIPYPATIKNPRGFLHVFNQHHAEYEALIEWLESNLPDDLD